METQPKSKKRGRRPVQIDSQDGVQADRVPPEVRHLVNGTVINLAGASAFYKKKAEVATLLKDFVEPLPDSHYRLKNQFESWFLGSLPLFFRRNDSGQPADILAEALFLFGQHWAKIDSGKTPMASIPTDNVLRKAWEGADEWDAFLHRDGCVGQGWIYEIDDDGRVRAWSGGSDPDVFHLWIRFGNKPTQPPTMTIEVKGKAAAIFMSFWMTLNLNSNPEKHPGKEELRKKAGSVLDSIVKNLKTKLTILRPEKGRPSSNFGESAAYLLDHLKKNIAWVAKELCHLPQNASPSARRQCFDRIRKAATNYYGHLRSDYMTFEPERVRQRVIHVPGSVSPVKSE